MFRAPQAQHRAGAGLLLQKAGVKHLITGTGAGQWGTALAMLPKFGLACTVFMVGISYRQKPQRRTIVGCSAARSMRAGALSPRREALKRDPGRIGSLAVATGEAIELAREKKDTARFAVGSGGLRVAASDGDRNEAVSGWSLGDFRIIVACMGAGSNFAGSACPSCVRPASAEPA
jgi:tryptophan synthase beta chain